MIIDVIKKLEIKGPIFIADLSQGDFIAARIVLLEPKLVQRLILMGTSMYAETDELFAISIALAIYTAIGFQQQKQQAEKKQKFDLEQSKELRQQTLYDEFLNNIYKLDKDGYLNDTKNPWAFANAYYRAAHRQWDTILKADVLQFLKEKRLIGRDNCSNGCKTTKLDDIIRLNELNFDNVHL
ncbi:unnamed protein product, partial [Adineta steineri]